MSAGSDGVQDDLLYDGRTARPWPVQARCGPEGLTLSTDPEDRSPETFPWEQLVLAETRPGRTVLAHTERAGWRLFLSQTLPAAYRTHLGRRHSETGIRRALLRRPVVWALALTLTVLVLVGTIGTEFAAWLVPEQAAHSIGDAVVAQLAPESRICRTPEADAVLGRLARRLAPSGLDPGSLSIAIADYALVNAITAPGGRIVILRGLIERVEDPDAFAGVLAHELGHAAHRHPLQAQVRALGLSFVLRAFGGDVGSLVDTFGGLRFSRAMEEEADATTKFVLARERISPTGLADFFDALAEERAAVDSPALDVLGYLSTHPDPVERAARLRSESTGQAAYRPALTESEWNAIKAVCSETSTTEESSNSQ